LQAINITSSAVLFLIILTLVKCRYQSWPWVHFLKPSPTQPTSV